MKGKLPNAKDQMKYGNNRIVFDSDKNKKEVLAQSLLEHAGFLALEADPDVASYDPHPDAITVTLDDGKTRKSVFDACVNFLNGEREYVEYKYSSELKADNDKGDRSRSQIALQKAWCEAHGYRHRVITDEDLFIGKPFFYNNLIFMTQRLRPERAGDSRNLVREKALRVLEKLNTLGGKAVIGDLITDKSDFDEVEDVMTSICYLLIYRMIRADLDTRDISYGMEVRVQ